MPDMPDDNPLRLPWALQPLDGKYYGTVILNCDAEEVMKIWRCEWRGAPEDNRPSSRESQTEAEIVDTHYETAISLRMAQLVIERMNSTPPE